MIINASNTTCKKRVEMCITTVHKHHNPCVAPEIMHTSTLMYSHRMHRNRRWA